MQKGLILLCKKHEAPVCEKESVVYARVKVFFALLEKGSRPINQIDRKRRREKKNIIFRPKCFYGELEK